jgi:hypothetical protein
MIILNLFLKTVDLNKFNVIYREEKGKKIGLKAKA